MKKLTNLLLCSSLALVGAISPILCGSMSSQVAKADVAVEEYAQNDFNQTEADENVEQSEHEETEQTQGEQDVLDNKIDDNQENSVQDGGLDEKTEENELTPKRQHSHKHVIVFGGGKVSVTPDVVYVNIGVESRNPDLKAATEENNAALNNVLNYLKENNIPEDDIKTNYYSIYQRHDYSSTENFQNYQVSSGLEIKFTDLDNISQYISDMTALGANQLGGITFDCSDTSQYYQEALKMAVEDAKNKAYALLGEDLSICGICEECVYTTMPYRLADASLLSSNASNILKGKMDIEAKIKVIFK